MGQWENYWMVLRLKIETTPMFWACLAGASPNFQLTTHTY